MIVDGRTVQLLSSSTRFGDLRELAEVDSTNRYLLDLARHEAPEGVVVVADHQSAGRGRLGRAWEAPPGGALLASILLRPALPPERRWLVTAAVALAAADACEAALDARGSAVDARGPAAVGGGGPAADARGPVAVEIKWPNDLLLGGAKLAGILAEADGGAVVVGIGVNVAWAPPGAASLDAAVGRGMLLAAVLVNLERWCNRWDAAGDTWRRRCATVGRPVRVDLPGRTVVGRAEAIEADGRLRIAVARDPSLGGPEILLVSAADVVHLRAAQEVTGP